MRISNDRCRRDKAIKFLDVTSTTVVLEKIGFLKSDITGGDDRALYPCKLRSTYSIMYACINVFVLRICVLCVCMRYARALCIYIFKDMAVTPLSYYLIKKGIRSRQFREKKINFFSHS